MAETKNIDCNSDSGCSTTESYHGDSDSSSKIFQECPLCKENTAEFKHRSCKLSEEDVEKFKLDHDLIYSNSMICHCTECGIYMGSSNPRQLCGKRFCNYF